MRRLVARVAALPDPECDSAPWLELMAAPGPWASSVRTLHFFESALDRTASGCTDPVVCAHECPECHEMFASARALCAHRMKRHGVVNAWSRRVDSSGLCPVCSGNYRTRLRVLNHLRSSACGQCMDRVPELGTAVVAALRCADRVERASARRQGFTVPRACGPAMSATHGYRPGGRARL